MRRDIIATDSTFKTRHGRPNGAHIKTLAAAVRRGGALTPITLWKQEGRNSLILLDGEHRLAAYRAAAWRGDIPARIATCSRKEALLIAASANTRDALPLSQGERADVAWRLVREPEGTFSKMEIARASGVSARTVATMRDRWRVMQGTEREPIGSWFRDRKDSDDDGDMQRMTDAERRAKIEALAAKLQKAAGRVAFHDEHLFAEALDVAFGANLRVAIDFLYTSEDVDEWLSTDVPDGDENEDDGEEPAF